MKKKIKIGGIEISGIPKVVAVITHVPSNKEIKRIKDSGADLVELRIDTMLCDVPVAINLAERFKSISLPVILTIRKDVWDRKVKKNKEAKRLEYFTELIPCVDAVDIEIESKEIGKNVIDIAKQNRKIIIFSYHDYNSMPEGPMIKKIYKEFISSGADILKIAGFAKNIDDSFFLMSCARKISVYKPVVAIAMGRAGEFTRIYGGFFGSCLTYAYLDKKVAPGQLSLNELRKKIDTVYSEWISI